MMPGLLEAPAFLCPLILSFRESYLAEAHFLRRTLLKASEKQGGTEAGTSRCASLESSVIVVPITWP